MRKGTIKRPPGATEPIIRLAGIAEPASEETVSVEYPNVPKSWQEVLKSMFPKPRTTENSSHWRANAQNR